MEWLVKNMFLLLPVQKKNEFIKKWQNKITTKIRTSVMWMIRNRLFAQDPKWTFLTPVPLPGYFAGSTSSSLLSLPFPVVNIRNFRIKTNFGYLVVRSDWQSPINTPTLLLVFISFQSTVKDICAYIIVPKF